MFQISHFGLASRTSAIAIALKVAFFGGVNYAVGIGHALSHLYKVAQILFPFVFMIKLSASNM